MKIKLVSDIHIDIFLNDNKYYTPNLKGAKVLCLAGDVGEFKDATQYIIRIARQHPNLHIVHVSGNHFYYGEKYVGTDEIAKDIFNPYKNIHHLENDSVVINGIKFIGATMWTNFNKMDPLDIRTVWKGMNDRKYIKGSHEIGQFTPHILNVIHNKSVRYILDEVENSQEPCVVITHHKPYVTGKDVRGKELWSGYCVDLDKKINECKKLPTHWFYGHTHESDDTIIDYDNGQIRFMANCLGYPSELNKNYKEDLIEL